MFCISEFLYRYDSTWWGTTSSKQSSSLYSEKATFVRDVTMVGMNLSNIDTCALQPPIPLIRLVEAVDGYDSNLYSSHHISGLLMIGIMQLWPDFPPAASDYGRYCIAQSHFAQLLEGPTLSKFFSFDFYLGTACYILDLFQIDPAMQPGDSFDSDDESGNDYEDASH